MQALTDQQLYIFDTTGFLHIENAFSAAEVERFDDELRRVETVDSGFRRTARYKDLCRDSPLFHDLARDDRVLGPVRSVINQPLRILESYGLRRGPDSVLFMHGGYGELLDIDGGHAGRNLSIIHTYHDGKLHCGYVKVIVYLTDVARREDGAFCYLQGSHKANFPLLRPRMESGNVTPLVDEGFPTLTDLYVRAGSIVVLNEALMHGTHRKHTEGDRVIMAFSYGPTSFADWREMDRESDDLTGTGYIDHDVEEDFVR